MRLERFRATRRRERISADDRTASSLLAEADALVAAGRLSDAVDRLASGNRDQRDAATDIRTLELRERAAIAAGTATGRVPWPPVYDDPFPGVWGRLPEIDVKALSAEVAGGAIAHHGALIVRNLIDHEHARQIIEGIHQAKAHRDRMQRGAAADDEPVAWYRPYPQSHGPNTRGRIEQRGNIWMADSPANAALILDLFRARGVLGTIEDHLGERPCFSLQKSTLRRLEPVFRPAGWHQDGAFLGAEVRTINVWTALSPCGGDRPTPGLELVPTRLDEILSIEGGLVVSSIAPQLVEQVTRETPSVRPEFEPGDGLLFDERFLHSTYLHEHMTEHRYALECWFFAPSHRPGHYVPFLA